MKYRIYIDEDNGWSADCPCSYKDLYFGELGRYVSSSPYEDKESPYYEGHIEFDDIQSAQEALAKLHWHGERPPSYGLESVDD